MAVILMILDGLGGKINTSALSKSKHPNMDSLLKNGTCGLIQIHSDKRVPESEGAHLELFGYSPEIYLKGRGPLEALGAGIKLCNGDIAFRTNFATIDSKGKVLDRRAGRIKSKEAKKLEKEINSIKIKGAEIIFKQTVDHRGVLILRGKGLSHEITNTDPAHPKEGELISNWKNKKYLKSVPIKNSKEAKRTAEIINEFTKKSIEILSKNKMNKSRILPANILLLRGPGYYCPIAPMKERFGIKACCIAGGALYKGCACYVGMDNINVKGATGDEFTDLNAKIKATLKAVKKYDLVFLHIKATDVFGHDKNCKKKIEFIEKIDKAIKPLMKLKNTPIIITGDHATPCSIGEHTSDPVPILIYADEIPNDKIKVFNEKNCAKGELGLIYGKHLMPIITYLLGL
ncbi:2,3-bisphosphoglycerate-independent phosphoglycerate mutase [Candidatus Micrarchaeota archaeon]|nr:2,3-bisphosphoglycerate-independent phosphoglycerate mutase [Candidatus Micrarchaeota archaeon]